MYSSAIRVKASWPIPISTALVVILSFAISASAQSDPAILGQWSAVQSWPSRAVHAHMLPTGKVLYFPYHHDSLVPQLWDPATNSIVAVPRVSYDLFCSGHSFLADGRLLVSGGHIADYVGESHASVYDPVANSWISLPDMNAGRWYPTNTTLSNGDVLVVSGDMNGNPSRDTLPQVWEAASGGWRNLSSALQTLPLYPFMFVAPKGEVFFAGPYQNTQYLNTAGTGAWTAVAKSNFGFRDYGSAVMFDDGKVLIVGGGKTPTATVETIDLASPTPTWKYVAPMHYARRQINATILPDGTVFVNGGSSGASFDDATSPVYPAEVWDSNTNIWTVLAGAPKYRGYHSVAVLLPDGRVLTAGGNSGGLSAETFSPPYLFKGPRPTIAAAPATINYGQSFSIDTPDAPSIGAITLIGLSSVTHAYNQNQRISKLTFTTGNNTLNANTPAGPNLAPPGYYMVFIINNNGVPSLAKFVRLAAAPISGPPAAPSDLSANSSSATQIALKWTDNSSNESGDQVERSLDGTNFTQIGVTPAGSTSYNDVNLQTGTQYFYRMRAYNDAGVSSYSNIASAVPANPACQISTVQRTVTICSPTASSSNPSPVHVVAKATDANRVRVTQVYVDGTKRYEIPGDSINADVSMATGTRRVTVQAIEYSTGIIFKTIINIQVQ